MSNFDKIFNKIQNSETDAQIEEYIKEIQSPISIKYEKDSEVFQNIE